MWFIMFGEKVVLAGHWQATSHGGCFALSITCFIIYVILAFFETLYGTLLCFWFVEGGF